jgi:ATP-dependent RNA helicase YTHDC2
VFFFLLIFGLSTGVFQSHGAFCRKIILSTNIAETSVTIDDVVYVIDTGKVKQKSFDSLTGTSLLQATWISKACGKQRAGRAGRTQPGVCLRLYSTQRHDHMDDFTVPEILRVPLTEICLQTKLIARQTTIGEFLAKAIQAPAPLSVRQSISLLQAIGALDEQENLTELGVHLADLPVDVRLGKTLIYSVLLKCLDPVLTIVAALSVNDPFTLPAYGRDKERMVAIKKSLAENSMSDHLALLRIFQKWNDSKNANRDRQFCAENFVSSGTMATICGLRSQILGHLRSVELVKSRGAGNIHELNTNSDSWAVVKACIAAGLYPNICRIDRATATLKSRLDTKIVPHSSSIFRDRDIKKSKDMLKTIPSDWIFYEEKSRFGRLNLIKCNTVVTPVTVALFAGPIKQTEEDNLTTMRDIDSDSDNDQGLPNVPAYTEIKYTVDDWIYFCLDTETAFLTFHLRQKLNALLVKILHNPSQYFQSEKDSVVIKTITQLLDDEERRYKLPLPSNIGARPKTVMLGFAADLHYGAQETNEESRNIDQLMRQSVSQQSQRPRNEGSSRRNGGQRMAPANDSKVHPFMAAFDASRYFLVKANIRKDVNVTINGGRWQLSNTVYDYLYKLVKVSSIYLKLSLKTI